MWKGFAIYSSEENAWIYEANGNPKYRQHNHQPSIDPSAHPQHRKITGSIADVLTNTSKHPSIRARDIGALIADQFPNSCLTRYDISNVRRKLRLAELDGRSGAGAIIKIFDEENIPYRVKWVDGDQTQFVGLVFTSLNALSSRNDTARS